jgi:hypothetical protein
LKILSCSFKKMGLGKNPISLMQVTNREACKSAILSGNPVTHSISKAI